MRKLISFLSLFIFPVFIAKAHAETRWNVDAVRQQERLLELADTDRDKKITVLDRNVTFWIQGENGTPREVSTPYFLSNLLQELQLAIEQKKKTISGDRIFENPVDRTSRLIRDLYWDGLTRRVDPESLEQVLADSKLPKSEWRYLYVPALDENAYRVFSKAAAARPQLKVKVLKLPADLRELDSRHGLLTLALDSSQRGLPFVVPGGRFNEMYGWDSYFEALGLINDGRRDLARSMVDNFVYEIENYGKILNANRTYYLNRSQPPFLTSMISALAESESTPWLERALTAAIREYFQVWMGPARLTETGLSRYSGSGHGIPPEVEKGHFDFVLKPAATRLRTSVEQLTKSYNAGTLKDETLNEFFSQDRAVRESGHDTTYRWRVNGQDRAAYFLTVDLNSLLYKYELDIAALIKTRFRGRFTYEGQVTTSEEWMNRARARKTKMVELMWDPKAKLFFDFDFKRGHRSDYVSATGYYPFWAAGPDPANGLVSTADARAALENLSRELEMAGGLAATSPRSLKKYGDPGNLRQWEYPNGWAPHQMIAWGALENVGMKADRLVYKWLYTITKNAANFNGTVPEKTDVVARSHAVFAEYGNIGTQFSYITKEGFGWMNASYQVGLRKLTPTLRSDLVALKPPEWIF